jgi:RNA polymerase sigma-70 factor (ECF subfamily)
MLVPLGSGSASAEPQDLGLLYCQHASDVRRSLAEFGAAPHDVDDLCQEVFLVARRRLGDVPRESALRRRLWLRQVSRRVAAAHRRRAFRRRETSSEPWCDLHVTACEDERPDRSAERREQAKLAREAFATLDRPSQRLVELHVVQGLPLIQVAHDEVCDRKTARKRLRVAQRRLLAWFGQRERPGRQPSAAATEAGSRRARPA